MALTKYTYNPSTEDIFANVDKNLEKNVSGSANKFFRKFPEGETVIRLVAPADGSDPILMVHRHFLKNESGGAPAVFLCPRLHDQSSCPSCEYAFSLHKTGNPLDKDTAKDYFPQTRFFANAILRDEEERGPVIIEFGKTVYDGIKRISNKDPERGGGNPFNAGPDGFDIVIERHGKGKEKTRYVVEEERVNKELGDPAWQEAAYNLKEHCVQNMTYDQIMAAMPFEKKTTVPRNVSSTGNGRMIESSSILDDMED